MYLCAILGDMIGDRLQTAVKMAADLHYGHWRDGDAPLPYVSHPVEVLALVRHTGGVTDEDILCAAVLHDVLEETSATADEISNACGDKVAQLVVELTRREPTSEEAAGLSKDDVWALRAQWLLDEIRDMGPEATTVKLADRVSNVRGAHLTKRGKKLARYLDQSERILEIVDRKVNPGLWDALDRELAGGGRR